MRKITLGIGGGDYDDDDDVCDKEGERRGLIYGQKGYVPIVISHRLSVEN